MRDAISELLNIAGVAGVVDPVIELRIMEWCRRFVNEVNLMGYADYASSRNKGFAEHFEDAQARKMIDEIVRNGSERIVEKTEYGTNIRRRITLLHDKGKP
jgi:hypothetical protein